VCPFHVCGWVHVGGIGEVQMCNGCSGVLHVDEARRAGGTEYSLHLQDHAN